MKIGSVISNKDGLFIVTRITNNQVSEVEPLDDFISKNTMIKHDGEYLTIREIIECNCDDYLSKVEVIEMEMK